MSNPWIAVAGLARCGTTLTMNMLHAAGIPCIGCAPAFEVAEINHRAVSRDFLNRYPGHAFKHLDPHLAPLPRELPLLVIWLDRDPKEQAKSQAKFVTVLMGLPTPTRAHIRRMAQGLKRERPVALAQYNGCPRLVLQFEEVLKEPRTAALQIAAFLRAYWGLLDIDRMAAQVRSRTPECQPGLDIELAMLEGHP
jgi:hypothetical protein